MTKQKCFGGSTQGPAPESRMLCLSANEIQLNSSSSSRRRRWTRRRAFQPRLTVSSSRVSTVSPISLLALASMAMSDAVTQSGKTGDTSDLSESELSSDGQNNRSPMGTSNPNDEPNQEHAPDEIRRTMNSPRRNGEEQTGRVRLLRKTS